MKWTHKSILLLLCILIAYGYVVKEFRLFPFYQLKAFKELFQDEHRPWYYTRKALFSKMPGGDADVVMLGDSLIEFGHWSDLFPSVRIADRGIAGDGTKGLLLRMDSVVNTGAKEAVFMMGINDVFHEVEVAKIIHNYDKIIESTLKMKSLSMFYVMSVLYVGQEDVRLAPKIHRLNQYLEHKAKGLKKVTFLNLNKIVSKHEILEQKYSEDGIHLNQRGYEAWACLLSQKTTMLQKMKGKYCAEDYICCLPQ